MHLRAVQPVCYLSLGHVSVEAHEQDSPLWRRELVPMAPDPIHFVGVSEGGVIDTQEIAGFPLVISRHRFIQ